MLWARMLADLIVVFHATYVSFVVFGLVAILLGIAFSAGAGSATSGSARSI